MIMTPLEALNIAKILINYHNNVMIECCDVIGNTFGILMSETFEHFKMITKITYIIIRMIYNCSLIII